MLWEPVLSYHNLLSHVHICTQAVSLENSRNISKVTVYYRGWSQNSFAYFFKLSLIASPNIYFWIVFQTPERKDDKKKIYKVVVDHMQKTCLITITIFYQIFNIKKLDSLYYDVPCPNPISQFVSNDSNNKRFLSISVQLRLLRTPQISKTQIKSLFVELNFFAMNSIMKCKWLLKQWVYTLVEAGRWTQLYFIRSILKVIASWTKLAQLLNLVQKR